MTKDNDSKWTHVIFSHCRGVLHLDLLDDLENDEFESVTESSSVRFFDAERLDPLTL